MADNNTSYSKAKRMQLIEEGIIASQFTQKGWFVKIKPVFSLKNDDSFESRKPSILFSFVEKGKSGSGFDIYCDIDVFDNWADDVLDVAKTFKKTLEAEKSAGEKYPKTYKYITGSNGEKSVGFCPSTLNGAFATVNGVTVKNGAKVFANVPVDYDWLKTTMKWYKRISSAWYRAMAEQTYQNAMKYHQRPQEEDAEYDSMNSVPENKNAGVNETPAPPVKENQQAEVKTQSQEQPKPEDKTQKTAEEPVNEPYIPSVGADEVFESVEPEPQRQFINACIITKGDLKIIDKGSIKAAVMAENKDTKEICTLYFAQDGVTKIGEKNWEALKQKSRYGISLKIKAEKKDKNLLFVEQA